MASALLVAIIFQSTLPRRERRKHPRYFYHNWVISIHAPAKGATTQFAQCWGICGISIHAPAKGATIVRAGSGVTEDISIHAPAKGATYFSIPVFSRHIFQSTLPRRERQHLLTSFRLQYGYSLFHLTNKI